jgi:hypothetical protein
VINSVGACFTAVVLVIVLVTKFASGAWIVVVAMPVIWLTMRGIRRHYDRVALELAPPKHVSLTLPAHNRAIVLVSKLHLPTLRALAYARATRPSQLEAVTVDVDQAETGELTHQWDVSDIRVPLTVVASPYREITRPVVDYIKELRRESPDDIVTLYVPEYVLGHWWEQLLHNQSALRLKARLLFQPGVIVASVPYQLRSATHGHPPPAAGDPATVTPAAGPTPVAEAAAEAATPVTPAPVIAARGSRPNDGTGTARSTSPLQRLTADRETLQAEELQAEISQFSATPIAQAADHELVNVAGTLRAITLRPRGTSLTMEADLWDGTGSLHLVWLGRRDILGVRPGRRIIVRGRIARINDERTMYNPSYELRPGPDSTDSA